VTAAAGPVVGRSGGSVEVDRNDERPRSRTRIRRATVLVWGIRLALPLLLLAAWVVADRTSDLVPGISATVSSLREQLASGELTPHIRSTMHASLVGFALAVVIGAPLGFALGRSPYWYKVSEPLIASGYAVPRIIIYPVLIGFWGVTLRSKTGVVAISAFFPIVFLCMSGARGVAPVLVNLGRSMSMNRRQTVLKIILPATAPTVMFGLRLGFSIGFVGVILAEMFAATEGLGAVVADDYGLLRLPQMFAVIALIAGFAFVVNIALWALERRLATTVE